MNRAVTRLAIGVLILLSTGVSAGARQATAQLGGRVSDQSGAVLPGVTVTATQTDTGFQRTSVTDGEGAYVMPNLPTGPYRLEVTQSRTPGFEPRSDDQRAEIIALLQSADPRQQAWGAWLSGRNVLPEMIPLLQQVVSRRIPSVALADAAAVDLALDSLIQLDAEVSPDLLLLVYERRPAQALVLLSKNREDVGDTLLTLMRRENGLSWFAAANLALVRKPPRLAVALLDGMQITATLVVVEDGNLGFGMGMGRGSGVGCGGIGRAEGFPPWPSYQLTPFAASGVVVLAPGPTPIYYQRTIGPAGQTPAVHTVTIGGPSTADRLKYLAALGGFNAATLALNGQESYSVTWQGTAAVDTELVRLREEIRLRYALLLRVLVNAQLLTDEDASALPPPQVTIILHDGRHNRFPPLGDLRRD